MAVGVRVGLGDTKKRLGDGRTLEDTVPAVPCPPMGLMIRNNDSNEVSNLIWYIECKIRVNEVIGG